MESTILYELARNNVYGSLQRALEGLEQNCHGLMAESRSHFPAGVFKNDAFFYVQVSMARHMAVCLQEFCKARMKGEDYYDARRQMIANFYPHGGQPLDEEAFAQFQPSSRPPMRGYREAKREKAFRYLHLNEFATTVMVLDLYLHQNGMKSWPHAVVFNQVMSRVPSFLDPEVADRGFDKFPVPPEVRYLADAARWFKERSLLGQTQATFSFPMDPAVLPQIFAASSNGVAGKIRCAHYAAHFENLGKGLSGMITNGAYLQMLRDACPLPENDLRKLIDHTADVPLDLPQVLSEFSKGYRDYFVENFGKKIPGNNAFNQEAIAAARVSVEDFLTNFVAASAPPVAAVKAGSPALSKLAPV